MGASVLKLTTASLRKVLKDPTAEKRLKCEVYDILLYRQRRNMKKIPGQRKAS